MKEIVFDTRVIASSPYSYRSVFVKGVMKRIRASAPTRKWQLFARLHRPGFVLAVIVALVAFSGAVYAAVHFAPTLLQLIGKETNTRGAVEYAVSGLEACASPQQPLPERFEIKKEVTLTDDEVRKILQAKCEMNWAKHYAGNRWPVEKAKVDGKKTITHTLAGMIGTYKGRMAAGIEVAYYDWTATETPLQGQEIMAFAEGKEVPLDQLAAGDTILTAKRQRQDMPDYTQAPPVGATVRFNPNSVDLGTVAVFKLSLPKEYYQEKQHYITEIPGCLGNAEELCPDTPAIDIYPRVSGGEGATNPYARPFNDKDVLREISGTVTALADNTLTLKSRAGNTYTVTLGSPGFKVYNRNFVAAYTDLDATLKVGSNVEVTYRQPQQADPKNISKEDVAHVVLMLEAVDIKKGAIKGY